DRVARHQTVLYGQLLIESAIGCVDLLRQRAGRDGTEGRALHQVWRRHVWQQELRLGRKPVSWNEVTWERLPGKWIPDCSGKDIAEVASPLDAADHHVICVHTLAQLQAFEIHEEKRLILADRATQSASGLVAPQRILAERGSRGWKVEEITRIHRAVSQKLVD